MEPTNKDIEKLVLGELDLDQEQSLRKKIAVDPEIRKRYEAYLASQASFEYEIAAHTRELFREELSSINLSGSTKPRLKNLFIYGVAATVLILILSIISINLSHNDIAIADNYHINALTLRDDSELDNEVLSDALKAYYMNDFRQSKALMEGYVSEDILINEYLSWLKVLVALKMDGSKSSAFTRELELILKNENHEFHSEASKMKKQLENFWRQLVVKK
jgi:hypothetical protein